MNAIQNGLERKHESHDCDCADIRKSTCPACRKTYIGQNDNIYIYS